MKTVISKCLAWLIRPLAGVLILVVSLAPSAECFASAHMTPAKHACCAVMNGACDMSVTASCCPPDTTVPGLIPAKHTIDLDPGSIVIAMLSAPALPAFSDSHVARAPDVSSVGPPGVPTYLFVSSFRI